MKKPKLKTLIFTLVPLAALILILSVVLSSLEKSQVDRFQRLDDRVYAGQVRVEHEWLPSGETEIRFRIFDRIRMSFTQEKPPNSFRIIIAGPSLAEGAPYYRDSSPTPLSTGPGDIGNWLRADLETRFPSLQIEILNAGIGGLSTAGVAEVIRKLAPVEADLLLVITGNNDFAEGPAAAPRKALNEWVVYRALKKLLLPEPSRQQRPPYPPPALDPEQIRRQFRSELEGIILTAAQEKLNLSLATMPINLRLFPEEENLSAFDRAQLRQADRFWNSGDFQMAIKAAADVHDKFLSQSYQAHCWEALGNFDKAKDLYLDLAMQEPRGRMRPAFNREIRYAAQAHSLLLIDLQEALETLSPHGLPPAGTFVDNSHLHWRGYLIMACEIERILLEKNLIRGRAGEPLPAPSEAEMIEKYHWQALYNDPPPHDNFPPEF